MIHAMNDYFDERVAACRAEIAALERDERRDEAVFAKIRLNVYDIFRTVLAAGNGDAALFLDRLTRIPENWARSLEQASLHGDTEKAHIEQIKLDTAANIRARFQTIREERQ